MKEHEILQWLLQREKALLEERTKLEKRIETVHRLSEEFEHMILTKDFDDNNEPTEKVCENEDSAECSCSEIDMQIDENKKRLELELSGGESSYDPPLANSNALIQNIDEEDIIMPEINDALSDLENEWKNGETYDSDYYKSEKDNKEEKPITKKDTKHIEKVIDIEKFKKVRKKALAI